MDSLRVKILKATRERLNLLFGPKAERSYFREVNRGPWDPAGSSINRLTVIDDGQSTKYATDHLRDNTLKVQLLIDLHDNWLAEGGFETWSNRVEEIIACLQNWMTPGCAIIRYDYISDDPFTAILTSGASRQIWTIDFSVQYPMNFEDFRSN